MAYQSARTQPLLLLFAFLLHVAVPHVHAQTPPAAAVAEVVAVVAAGDLETAGRLTDPVLWQDLPPIDTLLVQATAGRVVIHHVEEALHQGGAAATVTLTVTHVDFESAVAAVLAEVLPRIVLGAPPSEAEWVAKTLAAIRDGDEHLVTRTVTVVVERASGRWVVPNTSANHDFLFIVLTGIAE